MNRFIPATLVSLVTLAVAAVAAGGPAPAGLPTGKWTGEGVFTVHRWPKDAGTATDSPHEYETGRYKTHLTIESAKVDGQPAYRIEILSERGKHKLIDGDRTHMVLVLVQRKAYEGDGAPIEYACVESGLVTDASPLKTEKNNEIFPIVTAVADKGGTTLHLTYGKDFADVITFRGAEVVKTGTLTADDGVIQWTEQLKQK
ncbi:MAG: hypothetical protein HRF50_05645 [Phycisphaerae bacterium]|jgi:hypothetical protein